MTRYFVEDPTVQGGKVKWGKVGKKIKEGAKTTGKVLKEGTTTAGKEIKKGWKDATPVLMKEVLPAAVSMGIPITSAAFGALATMYGGPAAGMLAQQMTQTALQEGIPDKYQSDNKWVQMAGQMAGSMASIGLSPTSGLDDIPMDVNPYHMAMAETMGNFTQNLAQQDYSKNKGKSHYDTGGYYANPAYSSYYPPQQQRPPMGRPNTTLPIGGPSGPTGQIGGRPRPKYNPDDPYADLMEQLMNKMQPPTTEPTKPTEPVKQAEPTDTNDALYKKGQADEEADEVRITQPPYAQKEGSMMGLLGAGVKRYKQDRGSHSGLLGGSMVAPEGQPQYGYGVKRRGSLSDGREAPRGRPKKISLDYDPTEPPKRRGRPKKAVEIVNIEEEYKPKKGSRVQKVEIVKYQPYEKFSHAPNASLKQLLDMNEYKQNKSSNSAMLEIAREMKGQFDDLKRERDFYKEALGAGIRPKKGSKEAKEWGQRMKEARDAKKRLKK